MKAILIKYGHLKYNKVKPKIEEVGYPFQTFGKNIKKKPILPYSLHTEYSASILKQETLNQLNKYNFKVLASSLKSKKSSLWASIEWTLEFIDFIHFIVTNRLCNIKPTIIEIHPPYIENRDYNATLDDFFQNYQIFEQKIKKLYSDEVVILIENRNQSGNFLLSKSSDYIEFKNKIIEHKLDLKLIVDIPQLYGKMLRTYKKISNREIIKNIFNDLSKCGDIIGGFHICGNGHRGDFDDLFKDDKEYFLIKLKKLTNSIFHNVYIVPEIMKQQDFENIMYDIKRYKIFNFI